MNLNWNLKIKYKMNGFNLGQDEGLNKGLVRG